MTTSLTEAQVRGAILSSRRVSSVANFQLSPFTGPILAIAIAKAYMSFHPRCLQKFWSRSCESAEWACLFAFNRHSVGRLLLAGALDAHELAIARPRRPLFWPEAAAPPPLKARAYDGDVPRCFLPQKAS